MGYLGISVILVLAVATVYAGNYRNADGTCVAGYFTASEQKECDEECYHAFQSTFTKGVCRKMDATKTGDTVCVNRCGFTLEWWSTAAIGVVSVAAVVSLVLLCPMCIASCAACFAANKASDNAKKAGQSAPPQQMYGGDQQMTGVDVAPQKTGMPQQQQQGMVATGGAGNTGTMGYGNYGSYWPFYGRY